MSNRQRRRQPDYPQIYFGWLVWRAIFRVLGAVIVGVLFFAYLIVYYFSPNDAPNIFAGLFFGLMVIGLFAIFYGVIAALTRKSHETKWHPEGALANPPEPWLDANGNRLWKRVGDRWERTTTLER